MAGDAVSEERLGLVTAEALKLAEAFSELWELPAEQLPVETAFSPSWEQGAGGR